MKTVLIGGLLIIGSLLLISNSEGSNSSNNEEISLCEERGGERVGIVRGVVSKVTRLESGQWVSNISTANGCSGSVLGHMRELGTLTRVGTRVSFKAKYSNGYLNSPRDIKVDYSVLDSKGNLGTTKTIKLRINETGYTSGGERVTIPITGRDGWTYNLLTTRGNEKVIKYGSWHWVTYDPESNEVVEIKLIGE